MPDFDLVIEIAKYYDISIEEIFDGERKNEMIEEKDKKTEQMLLKVADYEEIEKHRFSMKICLLFIAATLAFILYSLLNYTGLDSQGVYEQIASCAMGIVGGTLLVGVLYTSGYLAKIKVFKKRLMHKIGGPGTDEESTEALKGNRVICTVLCIFLYVVGIAFGVMAILGRTSAYSAAISCLCAATVIVVHRRRNK